MKIQWTSDRALLTKVNHMPNRETREKYKKVNNSINKRFGMIN